MHDQYIAGFVDGEGCFHVAFQRSASTRIGWQAIPEFHLSQNAASRGVLDAIRARWGCGIIKENHRGRLNDRTLVLVVRPRVDLVRTVIPFFRRVPLYTQKRHDFQLFSKIVAMMERGEHRAPEGFARLVRRAYRMNDGGSRRRLPIDRILCTLPSQVARLEETSTRD